MKRSKMCGEFSAKDIGSKATVMGFIAKYRNLGNLLFVDVRDRTGIVQVCFDRFSRLIASPGKSAHADSR
ncbi:MAG: OB-fold nucleic acid binding domain-containing protein [Clostridia bacterium]